MKISVFTPTPYFYDSCDYVYVGQKEVRNPTEVFIVSTLVSSELTVLYRPNTFAPAPEAQVSESETASVAPPAVAKAEAVSEAVEGERAYEAEPSYEPEVEPQAPEVVAESEFDVVHEFAAEPASESSR